MSYLCQMDVYNWVFMKTNGVWSACHIDNLNEVRNNYSSDNVIRSSRIETLEELIIKYDGNITLIKKAIK